MASALGRVVVALLLPSVFIMSAAPAARAQCLPPHNLLKPTVTDATRMMANFNALGLV